MGAQRLYKLAQISITKSINNFFASIPIKNIWLLVIVTPSHFSYLLAIAFLAQPIMTQIIGKVRICQLFVTTVMSVINLRLSANNAKRLLGFQDALLLLSTNMGRRTGFRIGGRHVTQYFGRVPQVSRSVGFWHPAQTYANIREWMIRSCARIKILLIAITAYIL